MAEYILSSREIKVGGLSMIMKAFLDATSINIADAGSFYDATEVESALQEVGAELLVHNLNGWEDASKVALSWDNTDKEVTLTFTDTVYYWSGGIRYSKAGSDTLAIGSDTSGVWWFWYDGDTLVTARNPSHQELDDVIWNKCLVFVVCWNANDSDTVLLGNELHGCQMSGKTHEWIHDAIGATFREGGNISEYEIGVASDVAISFDLTDVEFYDEDIEHEVNDAVDASGQYEQVLTGQAEIPVLFRDAVDGSWSRQAASVLPYIAPGGVPKYMRDDGAAWSQQNLGGAKFMLYYLYATNDWEYPVQMVQGSAQYNTMAEALNGVNSEIVNWGDLPSAEFLLLYVFVVQQSGAGTANLKIRQITDYRTTGTSGGIANPATDHGGLTGLGDVGDHLGYVLLDGTRPMTGKLDIILTSAQLRLSHTLDTHYVDFEAGAGGNLTIAPSGTSIKLNTPQVNISVPGQAQLVLNDETATESTTITQVAADGDFTIARSGTGGIDLSLDRLGVLNIGQQSKVCINETLNTKMTLGLTINQAGNDDEILAFKSSDVSHPFSGIAEIDTYASFRKADGATGGLMVYSFRSGNYSMWLRGVVTLETAVKSTAGLAPIILEGVDTDAGTSVQALPANSNLVAIRNLGTSHWICDADGDTWQTGSGQHSQTDDTITQQILLHKNTATNDGTAGTSIDFTCSSDPTAIGSRILSTRVLAGAYTDLRFHVGRDAEAMRILYYGQVLINHTVANTKMTIGLTINQATYDDEILAFKSSDVGHGMEDLAEVDTYAAFGKYSSSQGGLAIRTYSEGTVAFKVRSVGTAADTTKSTAGLASIVIEAGLADVGGWKAVTADGNLVAIRNFASTKWILDEDGDTWQGGEVHSVTGTFTGAGDVFLKASSGFGVFVNSDASSNLLLYGGMLGLDETVNTKMAVGLTINQGGYDDEILAFKSSDINHLATSITETDTWGFFKKLQAGGGFYTAGFGTGVYGYIIQGVVETENSLKATNATAPIIIQASLNTAGATGAMSANANIFCVNNHALTRWLVDADGDTWQSGNVTALGYIGAGTDPSYPLHVVGNQAAYMAYFTDSAEASNLAFVNTTAVSVNNYVRFNFRMKTDSTTRAAAYIDVAMINIADAAKKSRMTFSTCHSGTINDHMSLTGKILHIGRNAGDADATAYMTTGIDLYQYTEDDQVLRFRSSDVGHGATVYASSDTFADFKKCEATSGGLRISGYKDSHGFAGLAIILQGSLAENADTTKGTAGYGIIDLISQQLSGDTWGNMVANGNIVSMRARVGGSVIARWILDEDGDTWQSGSATLGVANALLWGDGGEYIEGSNADSSLIFRAGGYNFKWKVGQMFINETVNAKMTIGLTINQGTNDNEILAFKSSEINHALTFVTEADTYGFFKKYQAASGGLQVTGIKDSGGVGSGALMLEGFLSENVDTNKTFIATAVIMMYASQASGGNPASIVSNGNAYALKGNVGGSLRTLFLIDEDGDYYYDGVDRGSMDEYEDAELVRAFTLATSNGGVVKSKWDDYVRYNEDTLVELGILGAPMSEGPLVNGAQLQRLHNGAIWQLYEKLQDQALQIESLQDKLKLLEN